MFSCMIDNYYCNFFATPNKFSISRPPPASGYSEGYSIDNVCVPNGLETPVKLFSYPSYGAPINWEIC